MENLIPVTAFRPVSDLTSHAQLKMFRPGIRAGVFIWEKFKQFPTRLTRSRSQKLRSRLPGQPAFSYEHIEIFVKKRVARRDLGNRASPVNRAHMKRPLVNFQASDFPSLLCFLWQCYTIFTLYK